MAAEATSENCQLCDNKGSNTDKEYPCCNQVVCKECFGKCDTHCPFCRKRLIELTPEEEKEEKEKQGLANEESTRDLLAYEEEKKTDKDQCVAFRANHRTNVCARGNNCSHSVQLHDLFACPGYGCGHSYSQSEFESLQIENSSIYKCSGCLHSFFTNAMDVVNKDVTRRRKNCDRIRNTGGNCRNKSLCQFTHYVAEDIVIPDEKSEPELNSDGCEGCLFFKEAGISHCDVCGQSLEQEESKTECVTTTQCSYCTSTNELSATECSVCNFPMYETVMCPYCTFANKLTDTHCFTCERQL